MFSSRRIRSSDRFRFSSCHPWSCVRLPCRPGDRRVSVVCLPVLRRSIPFLNLALRCVLCDIGCFEKLVLADGRKAEERLGAAAALTEVRRDSEISKVFVSHKLKGYLSVSLTAPNSNSLANDCHNTATQYRHHGNSKAHRHLGAAPSLLTSNKSRLLHSVSTIHKKKSMHRSTNEPTQKRHSAHDVLHG
jgi:hypothetical protein